MQKVVIECPIYCECLSRSQTYVCKSLLVNSTLASIDVFGFCQAHLEIVALATKTSVRE